MLLNGKVDDDGKGDDGLLDAIFNVNSRLCFKDFVKNAQKNATWCFNAPLLRERIWKLA